MDLDGTRRGTPPTPLPLDACVEIDDELGFGAVDTETTALVRAVTESRFVTVLANN